MKKVIFGLGFTLSVLVNIVSLFAFIELHNFMGKQITHEETKFNNFVSQEHLRWNVINSLMRQVDHMGEQIQDIQNRLPPEIP